MPVQDSRDELFYFAQELDADDWLRNFTLQESDIHVPESEIRKHLLPRLEEWALRAPGA